MWWRACRLWRGNWPIRVLCVVLLLATFGMERHSLCVALLLTAPFFANCEAVGVIDTRSSCSKGTHDRPATGAGYMYEGLYGVAATGLSLATNVLATALVAYKSW